MSQNPVECRCPVRPCFSLGSLVSGSATEDRALREWEATHGAHPYAKVRDELATALQVAEGKVRSGEAVLDMVADVFGMRRGALLGSAPSVGPNQGLDSGSFKAAYASEPDPMIQSAIERRAALDSAKATEQLVVEAFKAGHIAVDESTGRMRPVTEEGRALYDAMTAEERATPMSRWAMREGHRRIRAMSDEQLADEVKAAEARDRLDALNAAGKAVMDAAGTAAPPKKPDDSK